MHNLSGVRYFPKDIFPRVTSQVPIWISQLATSQMCNFPRGNFPKVRLGPLRRHKWGPSAAAWTGYGPSAAARTDLGSCRLGKCTFWKLLLGKIPLGSCHLGKYPWEVATWENAFEKVPNIICLTIPYLLYNTIQCIIYRTTLKIIHNLPYTTLNIL